MLGFKPMQRLIPPGPEVVASPTTLAYLAGFFDGEGSVTVSSRSNRPGDISYFLQITISQTTLPVLQLYQRYFGGAIGSVKRPAGYSLTWQWRPHHRGMTLFLSSLLPFLILKKPQAEIALAFLEAYRLASSGQPYRLSRAAREIGEEFITKFSQLNQNPLGTRGGGRRRRL